MDGHGNGGEFFSFPVPAGTPIGNAFLAEKSRIPSPLRDGRLF
jgi:hypothetical protein